MQEDKLLAHKCLLTLPLILVVERLGNAQHLKNKSFYPTEPVQIASTTQHEPVRQWVVMEHAFVIAACLKDTNLFQSGA